MPPRVSRCQSSPRGTLTHGYVAVRCWDGEPGPCPVTGSPLPTHTPLYHFCLSRTPAMLVKPSLSWHVGVWKGNNVKNIFFCWHLYFFQCNIWGGRIPEGSLTFKYLFFSSSSSAPLSAEAEIASPLWAFPRCLQSVFLPVHTFIMPFALQPCPSHFATGILFPTFPFPIYPWSLSVQPLC